MGKLDILSILRSKSSVFIFKEIFLRSGETDRALLRRRLSYYVQKGELYAIRRGLYAKDKNYDRNAGFLSTLRVFLYRTKN